MTLTDETQVPPYVLPELMEFSNGLKVTNQLQWRERRKEIIDLFKKHVYGEVPDAKLTTQTTILSCDKYALNGTATRKQLRISFHQNNRSCNMDVLIYLPNQRQGAVPLFMGLNFEGNHTIHPDSGILLSEKWIEDGKQGVIQHRATEESRAARAPRWALDTILRNGFGLATAYYGDLDPDFNDGFQNGIHSVFYRDDQNRPHTSQWGSIAAWAWGLSRILDYCESDADIDDKRVAVLGHSRLGKAALWAGAVDERFRLVISNNSGCGGAALSRRKFGETLEAINNRFPHWFCENFKQYNDHEENLPIDQHMLLACIAPRPLYIASASEDLWADPRGEFLSAVYASPAYQLYGTSGLSLDMKIQIETPVMNTIGYHIRQGVHEITNYDWDQFVNFAKLHFHYGS
jgi:hypothetical protein